MKLKQAKYLSTLATTVVFISTTFPFLTPVQANPGCNTGVGTLDPMCPGGIIRGHKKHGGDTFNNRESERRDRNYQRRGRFISNQLSDKCIDVSGTPGEVNGAPLLLWNCETSGRNADNGSPTDQLWIMVDGGFIKNSLSGKCIDVSGEPGEVNGAPLLLWDCETSGRNAHNGSPTDQRWEFTSDGLIKNKLSGKCIDVSGSPGDANGAPLLLWDCETSGRNSDNGSPTDQLWSFANSR